MKCFSKIVNLGFGILFLFAVICSATEMYFVLDERIKFAFFTTLFIIGFSAALCFLLYKLEKYLSNQEKLCIRILYILPFVLLTIQIIFAVLVDFTPKNDLNYICKGAENFVKYGIENIHNGLPERHQKYFYVYPNNHMLFLIISGLYKISYELTGEISNTLPIIFNISALNISYIFMIASAKLLYNPSKACICAIRGFMFMPLITYSVMFYTDSLAMPFVSAGIYLYIRCRHENNTKRCYIFLAACGSIIAFGYKIKGSVIILLAAIIVDLFLHKYSAKSVIIKITTLISSFAVIVLMLNFVSLKVLDTSKDEIEKYEFPMVHWIMMSADGKGGYNGEDFLYTQSFEGYDNKTNADLERLGEKLKTQGASGFAEHLLNKMNYTWHDGTYMTPYYNPDNKFLNGDLFLIIADILHFSLLIKIIQGYLSKANRTNNEVQEKSLFLKICLCGLFLFLLIWEARCRYLVSFMALFALI